MSRPHIAGVGMTRFGKRTGSLLEIATDAVADLEERMGHHVQPDHVVFSCQEPALFGETANSAAALVERIHRIGVPATRVETAPSSGLSALEVADALVRSGRRDRVLVVGAETMTRLPPAEANRVLSLMADPVERAYGLTMTAQVALMTRAYLHAHDLSEGVLHRCTEKAYAMGAGNRLAQFDKAVPQDTIASSPIIADPLRLHHTAALSDGAAAAFVTRGDGPVRISGIGHATDRLSLSERKGPHAVTGFAATTRALGDCLSDAAVARDAIDIVETHDAFASLEGINLEDLGLYPRGTGVVAVAEGDTRRTGTLPVNPGGGLKARGHPVGATGLAMVAELFWQLTRDDEVKDRQAKGRNETEPRFGLAHNIGGLGNNVLCALLEAAT